MELVEHTILTLHHLGFVLLEAWRLLLTTVRSLHIHYRFEFNAWWITMCNWQAIGAIVHSLDRDINFHYVLLWVNLIEFRLPESWRRWLNQLLLELFRRSKFPSSVRFFFLLLFKIGEKRYFLMSRLYRKRSCLKSNIWCSCNRLKWLHAPKEDTSCGVVSTDRALIPFQHRLLDVKCAFHRWFEHLVNLRERHLLSRCHV